MKRIAIVRLTNYSENSNIIAENAHIEGIVRIFDLATRDKVEYQRMTEPVNNEERTAELVQQVAALPYLA